MASLPQILAAAAAAFAVKVLAARSRARHAAQPQPEPQPEPQPQPPSNQRMPEASGAGVWPVPGTRRPTAPRLLFGFQRSPDHVHQGIDIAAPEGTPVVAPWPGLVVHTNEEQQPGYRGYGKTVVVEVERHGLRAWLLFAHLSSIAVAPGDIVGAGQLLGAVGRTQYPKGNPTGLMSSGPHLHFEISPRHYPQDSEAPRMDPMLFLDGPPEANA